MYSLECFHLYIQAFLRIVQSFDFSQPLSFKKTTIRDRKTTGKKQTNAIIVSHATTRPLSPTITNSIHLDWPNTFWGDKSDHFEILGFGASSEAPYSTHYLRRFD